PSAKISQLVSTQNPEILGISWQIFQRVNGVGLASTLELYRVHHQAWRVAGSQSQHLLTLAGRGIKWRALPWVGRGYQLNFIKLQVLKGSFSQGDVGPMNGVKTATQKPDFF